MDEDNDCSNSDNKDNNDNYGSAVMKINEDGCGGWCLPKHI